MSPIYELVRFLTVIIAGYSLDKLFNSKTFSRIAIMMFTLALASFIHLLLVPYGKIAIIFSIALIGMATYDPDSIISTFGAMDEGGIKVPIWLLESSTVQTLLANCFQGLLS
jgi:OPA family glycerol-3-phosphate transporter-like MFS transporter